MISSNRHRDQKKESSKLTVEKVRARIVSILMAGYMSSNWFAVSIVSSAPAAAAAAHHKKREREREREKGEFTEPILLDVPRQCIPVMTKFPLLLCRANEWAPTDAVATQREKTKKKKSPSLLL